MEKYKLYFYVRMARLFLVIFVVGSIVILRADFSLAQGDERQAEDFDACLMKILKSAEDDLTAGRIKEICEAEILQVPEKTEALSEENALERRVKYEDRNVNNLWTITPHKQNYILLGAKNFSSPHEEPWEESAGTDVDLNSTEVKFQVSFKFMLWKDIFRNNGDLYFAYTQLAMWQLYNREISSPFRETNYEPEAFLAFDTAWNIFGFKNRFFLFGFSHQSNGREEPLSRSWNRIYANFILNRGNLVLSLKPWFRIPEDAESDDNPEIDDYFGYGELRAIYRTGNNTFAMMLRNNLKFDNNRGAVKLDWSFPLPGTDRIKGYVQYFNGYGECLLDYNASTSRLGVGLLLTDFL